MSNRRNDIIRILHVGEYVSGGVATYLRTLVSYDIEHGVENHIIMSDYKSEHDWNLPADRISYYKYKRSIGSIIPAIIAIQKKVDEVKPDVVFCHSTWAGVLGRLPYIIKNKDVKIIYNAHGWSFNMNTSEWKRKIYSFIEKVLSWRTDKIINVSKYEYNSAVKRGISSEKMVMIYNGISENLDPIDESIKFYDDKVNLLFVGRFDPQKGLDWLLEEYYKHDYPHIHLWIIGDNVVSDEYGIKKINDDKTTFLGWIPNDKMASYYNACDAVIMPSRWEAFGLVAIEAMKYGKPVIVSDNGALLELVDNVKNGYIFRDSIELKK